MERFTVIAQAILFRFARNIPETNAVILFYPV